MKKERYFGSFSNYEDFIESFDLEDDDKAPKDRDVLFACYSTEAYEGHAFVLFKDGKKLYEVNASHYSCNGLDDGWHPEETSWEALEMRVKIVMHGRRRDEIKIDIYGIEPDAAPILAIIIKENCMNRKKDAV